MISETEMTELIEHEAWSESPVLSVYLDLRPARAFDANRRFELVLDNLLRSVTPGFDPEERDEFARDTERARAFVSNHVPHSQSLVFFCDDSQDFFRVHELNVPVRDEVRWEKTAYVRPLLEAFDEFERYGVIFTDKKRARLYTVFLGEIEEEIGAFMPANVRHLRGTNSDQLWSAQSNQQRRADEAEDAHLRHVADLMRQLARRHGFDRLVLAGPEETTARLFHLMPKPLRARVAGQIALPIHAGEREVLNATIRLEETIERAQEARLVDEMITLAGKKQRAVLGLEPVVRALNEKRVWTLVTADGAMFRGRACEGCARLFIDRETCDSCGRETRPVNDFLQILEERVMGSGGKIEVVRGAAAERLREAGEAGALLRFA